MSSSRASEASAPSTLGGVALWPTEARNNLCAFIIERDKAQCKKKERKREGIKQNWATKRTKREGEGEGEGEEAENKRRRQGQHKLNWLKSFN